MSRHKQEDVTEPAEHHIQPFTPEDLELARNQFPDEKLASRALEKFARANWSSYPDKWFWKDNYRMICGKDVWYCDGRQPAINQVRSALKRNRHRIVLDKPLTLSEIDEQKPTSLANLVAHKSENQWALPRDHPRHLLNFPQEILDFIFEFTLSIMYHTISPDVITTNNKLFYKMHQTYTLDGQRYLGHNYGSDHTEDMYSPPLSSISSEQRYDEQGEYFVLHKVYRPLIDATLLRVCKSISTQATKVLYGGNVFQFLMTENFKWGRLKLLIGNKIYPKLSAWDMNLHRPGGPTEEVSQRIIQKAIRAIESQIPVIDLNDLIYHDYFARFLHTIGPTKAAMIKSLHFSGQVKLHICFPNNNTCRPTGRHSCDEDLIKGFLFHVPFINKFCTSLQRLVISIKEDYETTYPRPFGSDEEERQRQSDARLRRFLENDIRQLKTVRYLEVYKVLKHEPWGPYYELNREKIECAEKTEAWFKERAHQWVHAELEMKKCDAGMQNMTIGGE
ncbi:hypothetical protein NHQ30_005880 [Ciborinia camelliae]|nr:hypothetical protein NHQ30_005880 [Ciborinia camelliae]